MGGGSGSVTAGRPRLTRMQRQIRGHLLKAAGCRASAKEIAEALNLNVNGVSQSLGAMQSKRLVLPVEGSGADTVWQIRSFDT